ncbi:DUF711 family protein [Streptomyces sp. NBC_01217]|uniref:DUF711 family protein n=1 Tax=Streptomyces sp. NBC_01217 TaxID=2903779 RepID=UPI002E0EA2B9|nr:DUF711 family protein [Streptomyces sp. NBC_01217]
MYKPLIRTVTLGVAAPHPISPAVVEEKALLARRAESACRAAGYEVQTVRLSTRSVFGDLAGRKPSEIVSYAHELQTVLDDAGIGYCSLGPADAADPEFPLGTLDVIGDLLIGAESLSCTVQTGTRQHGVRSEAAAPVARIIRRLAEGTAQGLGNFRFAMVACVDPGGPFFPAAHHSGPDSLAIGLQGAGIVAQAMREVGRLDPAAITRRVRQALIEHAAPVAEIAERTGKELGPAFGGIDLSPAPAGDDSIAAAMESCLTGPVGGPGTLAVTAALTEAIRSTGLPTCGYNGVMLPVLEDTRLAQRWHEGTVNAQQLLAYSAVCGTGLDTIPLPGDTTEDEIAGLLTDVAAMAVRLRKPLSARLFPVPGKESGERTTFNSPYLVNTSVKR